MTTPTITPPPPGATATQVGSSGTSPADGATREQFAETVTALVSSAAEAAARAERSPAYGNVAVPRATGAISGSAEAVAPALFTAPGLDKAPGLLAAPGLFTASGLERAPGLDKESALDGVPGLDGATGLDGAPALDLASGLQTGPEAVDGAASPAPIDAVPGDSVQLPEIAGNAATAGTPPDSAVVTMTAAPVIFVAPAAVVPADGGSGVPSSSPEPSAHAPGRSGSTAVLPLSASNAPGIDSVGTEPAGAPSAATTSRSSAGDLGASFAGHPGQGAGSDPRARHGEPGPHAGIMSSSAPAGVGLSLSTNHGQTGTSLPRQPGLPSGENHASVAPGPGVDGVSLVAAAPATNTAEPAHAAGPPAPGTPAGTAAQLANVVFSVQRRGLDGTRHLTVDITPEELGPVRLTVTMRAGEVHLLLGGSSELAREALRTALPELRKVLEAAGLVAGALDVHADQPDTRPGWAGSSGGSWQERPGWGSAGRPLDGGPMAPPPDGTADSAGGRSHSPRVSLADRSLDLHL